MYIVIEIQKNETVSTITNSYDTRNEAENKYHTILAYAAISSIPRHTAIMFTEAGDYIKHESFEHIS